MSSSAIFLRAAVAALIGGLASALPLWVTAAARRRWRTASVAAQVCTLYVLDILCVFSPVAVGLTGLTWAFAGKTIELGVFSYIGRRLGKAASGLRWSPSWRQARDIFLCTALVVASGFVAFEAPSGSPGWEALVYQATMPGLAEELVFRGVLLGLIDKRLRRPCKGLGVRWGWGAVITTALFFFGHALAFDARWHLSLDVGLLPDFAVFGFTMCWLRYRHQSVVPCMVVHNVYNCTELFVFPMWTGLG